MKKLFLFALTLLLSVTFAFSKTSTINYKFDNIKGIDASSIYKVYVSKGNSNNIKVTYPSDLKEYISITNYNGVLKCRLNLPKNYNYKKNNNYNEIIVELEMNTISSILLSGAASLYPSGNFTTNQLKVNVSGASKVNELFIAGNTIEIDCSGASNFNQKGNFENCDIEISGATKVSLEGNMNFISGDISGASFLNLKSISTTIELDVSGASKSNISGSSKLAKFECSGASYINAKELECIDADIQATGASKVNIFVNNSFKANASSGSVINYYGNPRYIITKPNNIRKAD